MFFGIFRCGVQPLVLWSGERCMGVTGRKKGKFRLIQFAKKTEHVWHAECENAELWGNYINLTENLCAHRPATIFAPVISHTHALRIRSGPSHHMSRNIILPSTPNKGPQLSHRIFMRPIHPTTVSRKIKKCNKAGPKTVTAHNR